ncbi:hypothetical protein D3C83_47820 [compost metagenome]
MFTDFESASFTSSANTLIGSGWLAAPVKLPATLVGGPVTFGPVALNHKVGGWLPMPSSWYGVIG